MDRTYDTNGGCIASAKREHSPMMNLADFRLLVSSSQRPVVLLEGRRLIPAADARAARQFAARLAREFPRLLFRSGNAEGSDEAFSAGVAGVDASRLQVVAPYPAHRKKVRYDDATYESPAALSKVQEEALVASTIAATPRNKALIDRRTAPGRLAAKAAYLIRDTMKVIGHSDNFPRPICALFYVDPTDPGAGGTGHTIRVCRQQSVPFAFQDAWARWFNEEKGFSDD
jgi:hypothetical protein